MTAELCHIKWIRMVIETGRPTQSTRVSHQTYTSACPMTRQVSQIKAAAKENKGDNCILCMRKKTSALIYQ